MTSDETWINVFPFGLNDQYICCFIRTRGVAYTGGGSCAGCGNRSCRPYRHDLSIPEQHRALLMTSPFPMWMVAPVISTGCSCGGAGISVGCAAAGRIQALAVTEIGRAHV